MRQWIILAALLLIEVLPASTRSEARPFGFLFGEQPERSNRSRRRLTGQPIVEAPLPVPRPHFADDPPGPSAKPTVVSGAPPVATPPVVSPSPIQAGPPAPIPIDSARPLTVPVPISPPEPPPKPADIASPQTKPVIAASGATNATSPRQPSDDAGCSARLTARSVVAEPIAIGPQPDNRCIVVQPVRLSRLTLPGGDTVEFPDKPVIACTTADVFSLYVRDLLAPLAKGTFGTGIGAVFTGPGLECRSRDHIFGAKLSAHGQGLAVDIAQVKLADGRILAVGEPKTQIESAFEAAARAAGCGYFHTTLGPGSDSYHRTHWHFDLEVRGAQGDSKYCR